MIGVFGVTPCTADAVSTTTLNRISSGAFQEGV